MVKAVFFDVYGTLARFDPPREEVQRLACQHFGIEVTSEGISRGYAVADDFFSRENAHKPLAARNPAERQDFFAEYERLILQHAGMPVAKELAGRVYAKVREQRYGLVTFDDVLPTLQRLKELGTTIGLISNIRDDMSQMCRRLGILPYVDLTVSSQEAGVEKPHPAIFRLALTKAAVEPPEAIMVGDQYANDVEGARSVGITPILLDRYGHLAYADCIKVHSLGEVLHHLTR